MFSRLFAMLILTFISTTSFSSPFATGDENEGKKIFEEQNCNSCHEKIMRGDGNTLFTRAHRKIKNAAALSKQLRGCTISLQLMLFEEDENNIGAYLNKNFYKFK